MQLVLRKCYMRSGITCNLEPWWICFPPKYSAPGSSALNLHRGTVGQSFWRQYFLKKRGSFFKNTSNNYSVKVLEADFFFF